MLGWQDDRLLKDVLPAKDAAKIKGLWLHHLRAAA